ncbi:hypothetical protein [Altericroceibacterium spongiae]|nr:hypothetical protein [Altericroceibacterium spongiae]
MMSANDMDAAVKTYDAFVGVLKWAVPTIAVLVFVVVLLVA